MFYLALGILACYYLIILLLIVLPIKVSKNTILFMWVCHIISLAIIGYHIIPSPSLDLYRMYIEIDDLRVGSTTIFDSPFLLNNLIYWIVSKTNHNGWFAFISVVLIGGLELCIIKEYIRNNKIVTKAVALYFLGCNSNSFIVYLFIGRSFLVAAIFVWAFYVLKEKNKKLFWLSTFACCLIHALGIILLLFAFTYEVVKKKKSKRINVLMVVIAFVIVYLLNTDLPEHILGMINLDYFSILQEKYQAYAIRGIEFQQRREMIFRTLNLSYILFCVFYLWRKGNSRHEIWGFFILITFAGYNFSILFERMPYVVGIAMLPILNDFLLVSKGILKKSVVIVGAFILISQTIWGVYETWAWLDFAI